MVYIVVIEEKEQVLDNSICSLLVSLRVFPLLNQWVFSLGSVSLIFKTKRQSDKFFYFFNDFFSFR